MKKRWGVHRAVDVVNQTELERLSTKALLARLKRLHWNERSFVASDMSEAECMSVSDKIIFKSSPEWRRAYQDVKAILASREHIERKTIK
jgi:hypothetical protein